MKLLLHTVGALTHEKNPWVQLSKIIYPLSFPPKKGHSYKFPQKSREIHFENCK